MTVCGREARVWLPTRGEEGKMNALKNMTYTRPPEDVVERELLNHCGVHRTSFQAAQAFELELPLRILRIFDLHELASVPFLGCVSEAGFVFQDSQHFLNQEEAESALVNRNWEQRLDP